LINDVAIFTRHADIDETESVRLRTLGCVCHGMSLYSAATYPFVNTLHMLQA
jgi:hypothetical protein